jgi:cytochrome c553
MIHRFRLVMTISAAAATALALATFWGTPAGADPTAGLTGPNPYAQGCVDCHGKNDVETIGELLSAMKHRNVDERTSNVPGDCASCHNDDGDYTPLAEAIHLVHFEDPAKNPFVTKFGGNCMHCHAVDTKTGIISVKSGPKNW